ncbi:sugar ABC transporter permease [Listeria monocytogenes]|uniref:carbohydrate ABC transporter permease n=1 Tax=Listeria monocytogenes TaxID=1639 RepID=UPI0010E653AF|nr:sugar ABC transporter permease [Listeria monocytogenes]EAD5531195.1 sugar ABC transporter permease [Listeria monocytogenes]EAE6285517.1 sugar ABC transporter permease [Listeria monocytogenes]EHT9625852.1 sugar ABC transporter permease [Listeria monocytogenes]EJQ3349186.1 sugar ABC transporter permease [Listeria monocytogenes]MCD2226178.1 sugar ABC transporter permease [Listeria monocytogenes]
MATIRNKSAQIHQQRMAYLFIALPVLLLAIFMILPIGMALFVSFTDYDIVNSPNWIGFDNYIKMFRDPYFLISLKNTIIYTALFVPLGLVASLGAAILINMNKNGAGLFRTFFYVPVLCSTVATATIWYWLLNPQYGLINRVLGWFGINGPAWLYDSNWAMFAIVMMSVWMTFGTNMMIFLAGLQGIPANLYEASKIEGASRWKTFRYVTWPSLSRTTFLVTTMLIINAFQVFDQAYVLTKGGPGNSTITLVYYIYNEGFGGLKMGYASAISFVLFLIILVFSIINMRVNKEDRTA